jgi:hypothetical protein
VPILGSVSTRIIARDFIELAPSWGYSTVSTLTAIPAFVVGGTKSPFGAVGKHDLSSLTLFSVEFPRI